MANTVLALCLQDEFGNYVSSYAKYIGTDEAFRAIPDTYSSIAQTIDEGTGNLILTYTTSSGTIRTIGTVESSELLPSSEYLYIEGELMPGTGTEAVSALQTKVGPEVYSALESQGISLDVDSESTNKVYLVTFTNKQNNINIIWNLDSMCEMSTPISCISSPDDLVATIVGTEVVLYESDGTTRLTSYMYTRTPQTVTLEYDSTSCQLAVYASTVDPNSRNITVTFYLDGMYQYMTSINTTLANDDFNYRISGNTVELIDNTTSTLVTSWSMTMTPLTATLDWISNSDLAIRASTVDPDLRSVNCKFYYDGTYCSVYPISFKGDDDVIEIYYTAGSMSVEVRNTTTNMMLTSYPYSLPVNYCVMSWEDDNNIIVNAYSSANALIKDKAVKVSNLKVIYDTLNANKADKTDSRFTDARTPTAHTHTMSEITDWSTTKSTLDSTYAAKSELDTIKNFIPLDTSSTNQLINQGQLTTALNDKVSKDGTKTLTDVNFSQADKDKLDGIESGANKYILPENVLIDNVDYDKVIISEDVVTRFAIGAITEAGLKNPVTIVSAGSTLKQFIDKITKAAAEQPTKTDPTIAISFSSSASDEEGTVISSLSYTITTTTGTYSYDDSTGVSWTGYNVNGTAKTTTTGTISLSTDYVVGTSGTLTLSVSGTHTAGNVAHDNQGGISAPEVKIAAGTKTNSGTFKKTMSTYPYTAVSSSSTTIPTSGSKQSSNLVSSYGVSNFAYSKDKYIWVFTTEANSTKKIQNYSEMTKAWDETLGGTTSKGSVTFTMANGKTKTYYAYVTKEAAFADGTFDKIRFN